VWEKKIDQAKTISQRIAIGKGKRRPGVVGGGGRKRKGKKSFHQKGVFRWEDSCGTQGGDDTEKKEIE